MRTEELKHLILGLDVGGKVDRTVITLLERWQSYQRGEFEERSTAGLPYYKLQYLERFPLDVPTPQQVDRVRTVYDRVIDRYRELYPARKDPYEPYLVIDLGNVGQAHFDSFAQAGMRVVGINYLGDAARVTRDGNVYGVPKINLASALGVLMENDRLIITEGIADGNVLIRELAKFTWKTSRGGALTVEHLKATDHDDTVCALMVGVWFGENGIRELRSIPKPRLGL